MTDFVDNASITPSAGDSTTEAATQSVESGTVAAGSISEQEVSEQGTTTQVEGSAPVESPTTEDGVEEDQSVGMKNLRSSYQARLQELTSARERITELEALTASDSFIKIDQPVEEWDAIAQLEVLRTSVPPYYNKMAWAIIENHLPDVLPHLLTNPQQLSPELQPMIEASAISILQAYTGLQPEEIALAINQYRSMNMTNATATSYPNTASASVGTPTSDVYQLAQQYGLDPVQDAALLNQLQQRDRELNELRSTVREINERESTRTAEQVSTRLSSQVDEIKNDFLSKVELPPGYEHVQQEITDRLNWTVDRDPVVVSARKNLEGYYRQGTPDLKAVTTELGRIRAKTAEVFKLVSEKRLQEVREMETLKGRVNQQQVQVKNPPPSTTTTTATTTGNSTTGVRVTVDNAEELAVQRWRDSKLGRPS